VAARVVGELRKSGTIFTATTLFYSVPGWKLKENCLIIIAELQKRTYTNNSLQFPPEMNT